MKAVHQKKNVDNNTSSSLPTLLELPKLSAEELAESEKLASTINPKEFSQVMQFGASSQEASAQFPEQFRDVATSFPQQGDLAHLNALFEELKEALLQIEPAPAPQPTGLFPRFIQRISALFSPGKASYDSNKITNEAESALFEKAGKVMKQIEASLLTDEQRNQQSVEQLKALAKMNSEAVRELNIQRAATIIAYNRELKALTGEASQQTNSVESSQLTPFDNTVEEVQRLGYRIHNLESTLIQRLGYHNIIERYRKAMERNYTNSNECRLLILPSVNLRLQLARYDGGASRSIQRTQLVRAFGDKVLKDSDSQLRQIEEAQAKMEERGPISSGVISEILESTAKSITVYSQLQGEAQARRAENLNKMLNSFRQVQEASNDAKVNLLSSSVFRRTPEAIEE